MNLVALTIFLFLASTTQQAPTFECGDAIDRRQPRWMAHIQIRSSSNQFVCGGTLISNQHVLTAAHCLQGNNTAGLNTILNITLGAGEYSNVYGPYDTHQKFDMKSVVIPTNWNLESDIAIVTLSRPAIITDYVQPACLPWEDNPDHFYSNDYLSGWGVYDSSNTFSSYLHYTYSTFVIPSEECQQTAGVGNFSSDNVICSDGNPRHRFFYGDDGGPLMNWNNNCTRWFVIGVFGRGEPFNSNYKPNVFTRVRAHLDFIRSHTGVSSPNDCKRTEPTSTRPTTIVPTTSPTTVPSTFSCAGKADGNYPNPASACSITFYMCSNGYAYLFTCAQAGTVYRPEINACDWPGNVAACH